MKDWLNRFFSYMGLGCIITLTSHLIEIFRTKADFTITATYLGGYILIMIGLSALAAFVIKVPKKEKEKGKEK